MNAQARHTPGPWYTFDNGHYVDITTTQGEFPQSFAAVHVNPYLGMTAAERDANARLMSAGPELLAALKTARQTIIDLTNARWSEAEGTAEEWVADIDAAIAKAEAR